MELNPEKTYFSSIPQEVLSNIIQYVGTDDLLNFCEAFPQFEFLFQERAVCRYVQLAQKYNLHSLKMLTSKPFNLEAVTTLDFNGIYWIRASDLRRFVLKLINLKNLYIIHTKMHCSQPDLDVYNSLKIEKLAVTPTPLDRPTNQVKSVKTLYLNIQKPNIQFRTSFVFPSVVNIWVDFDHDAFLEDLFFSASSIDRVFCKFVRIGKFDTNKFNIYYKSYTNRKGLFCIDPVFNNNERSNSSAFLDNKISSSHLKEIIFENNKCILVNGDIPLLGKPDGYPIIMSHRNATQILAEKGEVINNIQFDDLSFFHPCHEESLDKKERYQYGRNVLNSENAKSLKRLYLKNCFLASGELERRNDENNKSDGDVCPILFKKPRIGLEANTNDPMAQIFDNLQNLDTLEIGFCHEAKFASPVIGALNFIHKLKNLEYLTMVGRVIKNWDFLSDVFKSCSKLKCIKIFFMRKNELLNYVFYNNIQFATNLEDLCFYHYSVTLSLFFNGLSRLKTKKLRRIIITCINVTENDNFSTITKFLADNPQIVLLAIFLQNATEKFKKSLQSCLNEFVKNRALQCFIVKKRDKESEHIPFPHHDLISGESRVCSINALEEFHRF